MGALDDWAPAQPCKTLVEEAWSAGKDATIFLYADAYHGFDVPGSKLRVRHDVRMKNRPNLEKGAHVGGNDAGRDAATLDVDTFFWRNTSSRSWRPPFQ